MSQIYNIIIILLKNLIRSRKNLKTTTGNEKTPLILLQ